MYQRAYTFFDCRSDGSTVNHGNGCRCPGSRLVSKVHVIVHNGVCDQIGWNRLKTICSRSLDNVDYICFIYFVLWYTFDYDILCTIIYFVLLYTLEFYILWTIIYFGLLYTLDFYILWTIIYFGLLYTLDYYILGTSIYLGLVYTLD